MKKKIEHILSGKIKYDQPQLRFSRDKFEINIKAGTTMQGELYLGTENNDKIQGYVTSSNRRFVPGSSQFTGTTIRIPYGIDAVGMNPGDRCEGWLCITSSVGEYKLPFVIQTITEEIHTDEGELTDMKRFTEIAQSDFREAYHLFTDCKFVTSIHDLDNKNRALYAGLSQHPVTYQNLEEFLIALKQKEQVTISLKTTGAEFYNVKESFRESFEIHRSDWGHLRLEIETKGAFLETEKRVITEDDFIGSNVRVNYIVRSEKFVKGNQTGEIIVRSPYQELKYQITASASPQINIDIRREEKKYKLKLMKNYLEYQKGKTDKNSWLKNSFDILERLREVGLEYPEYQFFEAYLLNISGENEKAIQILKKFQRKEFTRDELELAGTYLYLCTVTGLYRDKGQAAWKIQNFYRQNEDSFLLLWILLQIDSTYDSTPSKVLFMLEEIFDRGCTSPVLYLMAWNYISKDLSLLHRLSPFWVQVFGYAGKNGLLTSELTMRLAYLCGYEKKFCGSLYKTLGAGYEKFTSDDLLETVCKYIMKGEPRKPMFFKWFSLAVSRGLRITRLYEYYVETMDISYRRQLPKPLLMYFAYNDNSLGDARKAFVYASVVAYKDTDQKTYENYKDNMELFAQKSIARGRMDENYATLYQEFLFDPVGIEDGGKIAPRLFTYRLFCDDPKVHYVIVRHSELESEEVYECNHGVTYLRIYTDDAVILFEDDYHRRYASTVSHNLTKLMNDDNVADKLVKLGIEEPGLLLHYCENTVLDDTNVECFQKAAESECFTEEYRDKIRKKLLDFYVSQMKGHDLEKYISKMDLRQYARVDRMTLLEVLISGRMFRQAMSIVEEFGYEGISPISLLKLTSRMILKSNMAEDDELIALASEVYRAGKYDEVIIHYLMKYRFGPIDELISIWQSACGFDMDTYDFEERILCLLVFASDYQKNGEKVLEAYIKHSGKERIIGAYLTHLSYGIFIKEQDMSAFIRKRLEIAYNEKWPLNQICRLALLKDISNEKELRSEDKMIAQGILKECARDNLKFAFFHKLSTDLLSPYQLDDKTFVEYHAKPGIKVTLFYNLETGLDAKEEYKSEPLKEMYKGIFVRTFTLFYGETLTYYFRIESDGKISETEKRIVTMKKVEGTKGSKYQLLNQILEARKMNRKDEARENLKAYLRQEQYIMRMFTIDKENGK